MKAKPQYYTISPFEYPGYTWLVKGVYRDRVLIMRLMDKMTDSLAHNRTIVCAN